ncbi:MAG: hypothetical protein AAGD11_13015 [Planctomycetota bacterium]
MTRRAAEKLEQSNESQSPSPPRQRRLQFIISSLLLATWILFLAWIATSG